MSDEVSQSTILIKKADGSQVRMTMAEFREYKKNIKAREDKNITESSTEPQTPIAEPRPVKFQTPKVDQQIKSKTNENLPMKEKVHELATTAPVKDIFIDEAKAVSSAPAEWTAGDYKSLLEEELETAPAGAEGKTLPAKRDREINKVLAGLSFTWQEALLPRLRSLIESRLKDIRTDDQLLVYITKAEASGGLGWSQTQARELLGLIQQVLTKPIASQPRAQTVSLPPVPPLKAPSPRQQAEPSARPKAWGDAKPILHDVRPVEPDKQQSLGPIDEIRNMTLLDWRRLVDKHASAVAIMLEKLANFKMESFVWYLQAVQAWQASPLYEQYKAVIKQALASRLKFSDLLNNQPNKDDLKLAEFMALVQLNKQINY